MSKTPLFSVVIPTYNREAKLHRALTSLANQTLLNFEVLVCDDGSADGTRRMVETMQRSVPYRSLRYFHDSNWGGPARPRNVGISKATAQWICFLDSDDTWYPEKLERLLPYIDDHDLIFHDFLLIDGDAQPKKLVGRNLHQPVFDDLMIKGHNGVIINSGVCVRKTLLISSGKFTEDKALIGVEDADMWLRIARKSNRFKHLPMTLGEYYLEGENLTVYNQKMIDKLNLLFDIHAPFLHRERARRMARRTLNYHIGRIVQKGGSEYESYRFYLSSFRSANLKIGFRSAYWLVYLMFRRIFNAGYRT
jgi:glycosyltransferase involved in cell wall biosynthesis